MVRYYWQKS